ncbi:MAG: SAM-dependent methyltransferase [Nitrospirota bacterium]|nr:SAM-dependent methyltransferase [Nitrospirota bacterium]
MAQDGSQPNDRKKQDRTTALHFPGTLYIVGTPIGHPDDITIRALATLRRVSIIASEDPRMTQALLTHHGITATITSYGPLNRQEKVQLLLHRLMQGHDVAFVSDNGTPVIYDPGSLFVATAHRAGILVKTIPGPSVMTAATAISGFSGDAIIFEGRLPSSSLRLTAFLSNLREERRTLAFYVASGALRKLLGNLVKILPNRQVAIAINLTTPKETLMRGRPNDLIDQIGQVSKDSAVTVVIEGYRAGSKSKKMSRTIPRTTHLRGGG